MLNADELTDVTAEWLHAQSQEEPHKSGWLVNDCWMDRHSVRDHAETCKDCQQAAIRAAGA